MRHFFILLACLLVSYFTFAQAPEDVAVELQAIPSVSPLQIKLTWKIIAYDTPYYQIWRKAKTATTWGTSIATLTATDSSFIDSDVIVDSAYEYLVEGIGDSIISAGYIYAGIQAPAVHNKGTMIIIVDSTYSIACAPALKTLMDDISGDGWQIIRHDIARSRPDTFIRSLIVNDYAANPSVKSLFLVGHVAVPYSADFNASINPPDGHVPEHNGAWPEDVYYACFTGTWTDVTANDVTGSYSANWNIPGDGKWDQDFMPSAALLEVSRIDFYNMPSFTATDVQLMNQYLAKDHIYKMDSLAVIHRGLVNDNFGYFMGEAFAQNGWRNFSPLVGRANVAALPFVSSLAAGSYQWAYGCGGGSFTSASGVGFTSDFVSNPENGIFTMIFGSFFGDWNVADNFLRAPLCSNPPALTNCWAGRPNWFFHHMALGENIGYSTMLTQNNSGTLYQPQGYGNGYVHPALMGDLSLRTDYIKPITSLTVATPFASGAVLNWTPSPDPGVLGYYIYRADSAYGYFQRLNAVATTATTFHDLSPSNGLKYYMVRPVKLESTPSGGYYNLGVGVTDTGTILFSVLQTGNVQPTVELSVFPNPAQNYLNVTVHTDYPCTATMYVANEAGQTFDMVTKQLNTGANAYVLNVAKLAAGTYTLVMQSGDNQVVTKWVKF